MYNMKIKDITIANIRKGIESGVSEIEVYSDDDFLVSWDNIKRIVTYNAVDVEKYNPIITYEFCLSHITCIAQLAYNQGKLNQKKETSNHLKDIFGIK